MASSLVGKVVPRKEGFKKLTGRAQYVDDITFPGMLHGATIRSPGARGRIKNISFGGPIPWDEFVVVTAKDIPGENHVALILYDQPFLADKVFNHPEEPVALIAHHDKYLVEEARKHVRIEFESLPPVFTIADSINKKEIIWENDNIFKSYLVQKGDVDQVWNKAHKIIEGDYFTGAQEQLYIENNGMIAVANAEEGVTIWGSMQCPYYIQKALQPLFKISKEKIRIIQTETGGGFGGKEEYPSILAGHAALLAWKSGKPVKIVYSRSEDMVATTKRHPSWTKHKTAVDRDGKLLAMEIDFSIDGGAYATLSSVVLSRGTIHSAGPYFCENVRIKSRAVATSSPPHGAFRGFGAPQSIFALERHMDKIAKELDLSPEEFRRRNLLKKGQTTATSQLIKEEVDFEGLMAKAFKLTDYKKKFKKFPLQNKKSHLKKGIGFATFMHGAGFTGSGEKHLASVAGVQADEKGIVHILSASTEIGQGTNTIFSQVAAQALGLPLEMIEVDIPDTRFVPDSGPTVASRTCMIVGQLIETAALGLKQTLIQSGLLKPKYTSKEWAKACRDYLKKFGVLKSYSQYKQPQDIEWNDEKYQGDAYATYAWAVYVAEVTVDTLTFETRVDDFVAVQEVGKVVHPVLAAGQIEGGVAQAIGYALYENVVWKDGRMINNQMTNYIMPTSMDVPDIRVYFEEENRRYGPQGAKGIGELPMDGPAPAILNAIEHATGVAMNSIPLVPEILFENLRKNHEAHNV